jgi:hypothetical protein
MNNDNETTTAVVAPEANPFAERAAAQGALERLPVQKSEGDHKTPIPIIDGNIQLTSIEAVWRVAEMLHQARLVPASFKNPTQITVALLRAIELKLPPLQAIEGMSVINNKVGLMGDLALSLVESSGLLADKRRRYHGKGESLCCTVTVQRKGREPQSYSFSVAQAKAAGIYNRSAVWQQYPDRMTYYRALGFALRDEFSDVLKGIKTVEELQDYPSNQVAVTIPESQPEKNL